MRGQWSLGLVRLVGLGLVVWCMDAASAVMQTWHGPIVVKLGQGKVKLAQS